MLSDIRFAIRTLVKNPVFTIAAVLCLALGIGATATIFSAVRAVLLRPFPYRDPGALLAIGESNTQRGWHMNPVSYPNFRSWQADNRTLVDLGIYSGASYNLASGGDAEYVRGGTVSWATFRTLGVPAALGRDFQESDDRVGAPKVIILSDRLWRVKFKGQPDAIGQQITVDGEPNTIVGVMPPGFGFPGTATAWTPLRLDPLAERAAHSWNVIARIKPGVTVDQARQDLGAIAAHLAAQYPSSNTGWGVDVQTLRDNQVGSLRSALLLMMGSVAFVLLIACANVANLLLARAAARAKEMAVRVALGADRWRIVRQLLTESVVLALVGAVLGVGIAHACLRWVAANVVGVPFWMHFTIDGSVLAFTTVVAVATGILFGLVPAMQAARPDLNDTLRDSGRGTSAGRSRQRFRNGLVVGEMALSVVLLVGAALLIRSFLALQGVEPGFDSHNVLTMRVTLRGPQYESTSGMFTFWDRVLADLNTRPGIVSAAMTNNIPLGGSSNNMFITVESKPALLGQEPTLEVRYVSPRYLETMRIPLVRGRMFTQREWADSGAAGRVAVVNAHMARHFWGTDDAALGQRFKFGSANDSSNPWITVIGVAADVKVRQVTEPPNFQGYMPYRQGAWENASVVVRTPGDPARATATVLAAFKQVDPLVPAYGVTSMDANIARSYWRPALYGKLFGAFAAIAFVLAAVGVYGVVSYSVSQRAHELGVRVALGAQRGDVFRLVVGHGVMLGGLGIVIGLGVALGITRFLSSLLFGLSPFDPVSFGAVSALLAATALLASYLPARRAARMDPVEALPYE